MKIEIYSKNWTVDYVRNNPDKIFIFGDNNARMGKGGQAVIRDLENSVGLRTKKGPSRKPAGYFTDNEYEQNIKNINEDILLIKSLAMQGKTIVFSKNGYGTGLALLEEKAPKTFEYLCESLKNHFGFDNKKGTIWRKVPGYDEISQGIYISLDKKKVVSENIIQPFSNNYFKPELLSRGLYNIQDLIKTDSKIAFTQDRIYQKDNILIFTITGLSTYFVCRVVDDSYRLSEMNKEQWRQFEGFSQEYVDTLDIFNDDYYQTHFQFICTLEQSGKMVFRDDIFGSKSKDDQKQLSIDVKVDLEEEDLEEENEDINQSENYQVDVENNGELDNNKVELLKIIDDLKSEIRELKTPFYTKLFKYLKSKFNRKDIEYILEKRGLTGELSVINNIFNNDKNKTYYKLVDDKYTHFLVLYKGLFVNKVYIILTFIHE